MPQRFMEMQVVSNKGHSTSFKVLIVASCLLVLASLIGIIIYLSNNEESQNIVENRYATTTRFQTFETLRTLTTTRSRSTYTLDDAWETNTEDWWDLTTTRRTWSSWRTTWTRWTFSSTSTVPNMLPMDYEDPPENDTSRLYFSNQTNQTSQYEDYFQYGLNHSLVLKLRGHDDHIYSDFKIRTGFRVYNQNFTSFDIDTDGKLNFRNRATGYSLRLLPFECDIDTRFEGSILHTEINQTILLDSIGADIRKACNGTWFNPTWAYSVTWYLVRPYYRKNGDILYGSKSNSSNTFQLVLASNGRASFALFKYVRLDWPNSDIDVTFESGYRMTDSMFGITKKIFVSSNSLISKANLLNKSNMETPGTWILTFNHTRCSVKD